ncbi:hypothetical protein PI124_g11358 [Phytophthora idaei]|nr:hypothetical protein PI125_g10777 [Phytophthora idaei]KAG3243838.1 hypothetical protein PI124_g11358 [Phytophthora idaei]
MLDVKRVGADLTPAEQDEAIADLAFFLDEFGSTGAVRAKLEEQESDIKRLHDQIRRLLTHQNYLREEGGHNRSSSNTSTHPAEGVDETMKDLDFFITTIGTTREVREKLERQIIKIVGLRRTVRWLKEHQQARINSKESSGVELECKKHRYDPTEERSRESEKPSEIFKRDDTEEGDDVVEKVAACPKTDQTEVVKTVHTNEKHFDKEHVQASSALVGDAEIREHVDFELLLEANKVYSGLSPSASSGDGQHSHLELAGKNAGNGIAMPQVKDPIDFGSLGAKPPARSHATTGKRKACCCVPECSKYATAYGLCYAHGGYYSCKTEGCTKRAISRNLCRLHGGGTKCKSGGCEKLGLPTGKGFCYKHAREHGIQIKPKCKIEGCNNVRQKLGRCKRHREYPIEAGTGKNTISEHQMTLSGTS